MTTSNVIDPRTRQRDRIARAAIEMSSRVPAVSPYDGKDELWNNNMRLRLGLSYLVGVLQGLAQAGELSEGAVDDVVEAVGRI